jgi:hypothetical protein
MRRLAHWHWLCRWRPPEPAGTQKGLAHGLAHGRSPRSCATAAARKRMARTGVLLEEQGHLQEPPPLKSLEAAGLGRGRVRAAVW